MRATPGEEEERKKRGEEKGKAECRATRSSQSSMPLLVGKRTCTHARHAHNNSIWLRKVQEMRDEIDRDRPNFQPRSYADRAANGSMYVRELFSRTGRPFSIIL